MGVRCVVECWRQSVRGTSGTHWRTAERRSAETTPQPTAPTAVLRCVGLLLVPVCGHQGVRRHHTGHWAWHRAPSEVTSPPTTYRSTHGFACSRTKNYSSLHKCLVWSFINIFSIWSILFVSLSILLTCGFAIVPINRWSCTITEKAPTRLALSHLRHY